MKYIVTKTEDGKKEIFIFPRSINHDDFAEVLSHVKRYTGLIFGGREDWVREYREPVSAGFIDEDFNCYGESESLGLKSDPEDTRLLKSNGWN